MTDLRTDEEQAEIIKKWWSENGTSLVSTVAVAIAGVVGWNYWQDSKQATGEAASAVYTQLVELAAQENSDATADMQRLAEQLKTVAPTLKDAKHFVHLAQWDLKDHWGVDGYGDPLCTRISGVENTENLEGLFIHMKGCWHYSDDGIGWDPVDEYFIEKVA